ncbi:hypothetical protein JCM18918_4171 [Cutibacterium acnes JCM 18918]|nr:hypothetical protein JCM18918_4171 [Cutibacterium acnes JCM 18918]
MTHRSHRRSIDEAISHASYGVRRRLLMGLRPCHIFAVESAYGGHPASATLVLPPYSAIITSRA